MLKERLGKHHPDARLYADVARDITELRAQLSVPRLCALRSG